MNLYSTYPAPIAGYMGLLVLIVGGFSMLFIIVKSALENNEKETPENVELFRTEDENEYHSFLENFDEAKYKLVDVSPKGKSDKFYVVTYVKKTK